MTNMKHNSTGDIDFSLSNRKILKSSTNTETEKDNLSPEDFLTFIHEITSVLLTIIEEYKNPNRKSSFDLSEDKINSIKELLDATNLSYISEYRNKCKEINKKEEIINTLKEVINSLKNHLDYKDLFILSVTEQIDEEEFLEESEKYVISPKKANIEELARKIKTLYDYTNRTFTVQELSQIFKVNFEDTEKAIDMILEK